MPVIVDYDAGNVRSVQRACRHVGIAADISADPEQVAGADRLIFPGVGSSVSAVETLRVRGLDEAIKSFHATGKPLLGICVGMQALMARSEENNGVDCLGVFDGEVTFFGDMHDDTGGKLKVPHMGWNQVQQGMAHPMWAGIANNARFYFVHSYCVTGLADEEVAGFCDYGRRFAAAATRGNVFAVQFHPEKSADAGLTLLENFLRWQP